MAELFDESLDKTSSSLAAAIKKGQAPPSLSAPLFVLWEVTSKCAQNCLYCYNRSPKATKELSGKRLFQVADEIIKARVFALCLSGGDPIRRPEYLELLQYLSKAGISVGTVLSGFRVTPEVVRVLAGAATNVQISLDGATAEVHDHVRGRKGSFDDAVGAIKQLVEYGKEVHVAFAATKLNIHQFSDVYNLCKELGVQSLRTQRLVFTGKAKDNLGDIVATDEDCNRLTEFCKSVNNGNKPDVLFGDPTQHITLGLDHGLSLLARITAEGYVSPSPYLNIFFGDLNEKSMKEIWSDMKKAWHLPAITEFLDKYVTCKNGEISVKTDDYIFV